MNKRVKTEEKPIVIVAGSRRFNNYNFIAGALEALIGEEDVVIVTGGAPGVDQLAHQWAGKKKLSRDVMNAEWDLHGKSAGPIRNNQMARSSDALIAFHNGSKGTQNMIDIAIKMKLKVKIIKI